MSTDWFHSPKAILREKQIQPHWVANLLTPSPEYLLIKRDIEMQHKESSFKALEMDRMTHQSLEDILNTYIIHPNLN